MAESFGRCKKMVPSRVGGWYPHRCNNAAVAKDGLCRVHSATHIDKKRELRHAKYVAEMRMKAVEWFGPRLRDVLEAIAQGNCEDPATAARAVLRELEEKQKKIK